MELRIGEMVKNQKNVLLNVSPEYEKLVQELAKDSKNGILKTLIISQTEHKYRDFLIFVLRNLENLNEDFIVEKWNGDDFEPEMDSFRDLFETEWELFLEYQPNPENTFTYDEKRFGELFNDKLSKRFYPNRKKKDIIIRRLVSSYLDKMSELNDLQVLCLHFIANQLMISWEATCLYLGRLILEGWEIKKIKDWFCEVFLIYRS